MAQSENDFCESGTLRETFNNIAELKYLDNSNQLITLQLEVPLRMDGVRLSTIFLRRIDNGEVSLEVSISSHDEPEEPDKKFAYSLINKSDVDKYSYFSVYGVVPVYPDACRYGFELKFRDALELSFNIEVQQK